MLYSSSIAFWRRCVSLTSFDSRPQQRLVAGSPEHIINGRFNFGNSLPTELGWNSDDAALYSSKFLLDVFARNGY